MQKGFSLLQLVAGSRRCVDLFLKFSSLVPPEWRHVRKEGQEETSFCPDFGHVSSPEVESGWGYYSFTYIYIRLKSRY